MRSAHRRAPWALAAASSVTLALTGLAQTKSASDAKAPTDKATSENATSLKSTVEAEVSPSVSRLAEIKVELAWLGDRATFPCQLAARRVGCKLEVGGFVPDESLRKKAIELARANCDLPVVDKLLVNPGSAMVIARATHEELSRAAAAAMGRILAKHGEEFSFETDPSGEITIKGLIPTWEDKLTVSRRLSQLPGCTGVVNQFRVRNQMREGHLCNLVSIDGKLRVPAASNAVADIAAPKPAAFQETVQRVEAPNSVPLLPTEAPSSVAQGPVLLPANPSVSVAVSTTVPTRVSSSTSSSTSTFTSTGSSTPSSTPTSSHPLLGRIFGRAPVVQPSDMSNSVAAPPVVSQPTAPATVVLKKEATPVPASKPTVVANNATISSTNHSTTSTNSGLNGAPMKLPLPLVLGSNSPAKPTTTVANVVAAPALPSKPVASAQVVNKPATTQPVANAAPAKLPSPYAMQLGTPVRPTTPAASPIQQVSYQEPVGVNRSVNQPTSQPAANRSASPYGGNPYGATPAPGSPYSGSSGVRSASPYGAGSPYGATPATPAPASSPGLISRVWTPTPTVQPVQTAQASTPTVVTQPVQTVQATVENPPAQVVHETPAPVISAAPVTPPVTNWGTAPTPTPVAPKVENPMPAPLPSNVVSAPVVPTPPAKPVVASPVVPVSAQRITPTPTAGPVTSTEVQGFLCNRIQQIGEGKVRDVRVQGTSSNACVISLAVPTATEGQQVGQKIINMPELVPYKVDLQIRVQP
jgi:hypothetical protein